MAKHQKGRVKHPLKLLREKLGVSMLDVELTSREIARRRQEKTGQPAKDLIIYKSRLNQIERGSIPSAYKLAVLAEIYGMTTDALVDLMQATSPEAILAKVTAVAPTPTP